jgi:hypothetical protein
MLTQEFLYHYLGKIRMRMDNNIGSRHLQKFSFILISLCLTFLAGCNGHTDNGDEKDPQIVSSISFKILDSQGNIKYSFSKNEVVTLQATVWDEKNNTIANKAVNFSATIGSLTVTSKLTDDKGIASVTVSNETLTLGAGTASASLGGINAAVIDYEFVDNDSPELAPHISSTMMFDGQLVNQFKADQEVQIISTLLDENNQPISNQVITFTADVGVLSTTTALTNEQGIANVSLTSEKVNAIDIIGAGVVTSTYVISSNIETETGISSALNYQILAADAIIDSDIRLGYFDSTNTFIEGKIALSITDSNISAGGTLGLSVDLVDESGNLIVTPIPVTFTSNCVQNLTATIDESVLSINGTANSTFEDISCAGTSGTDDVLLASVAINGITNVASETISIQGEQLGSIEFISAEPSSIVLKGTGGQDQQETSTLTFKVKSQLDNVLAQQEVSFILSTAVGDIHLSRASGFTNSQGLITTQVSAGNVPTAVRVTASAKMDFNGEEIQVQSQSDLLSINTGLPEQRSMTIAASILNPEAHVSSGEESIITVWLSDNFNNPVPDGTTVNFTSEGGTIASNCTTINGSCSLIWESTGTRVADHRVTILATALGHESFFDTNGNNLFDETDGESIKDIGSASNFNIDSGLGSYPAQASGFLDMSEAWRDDNENSLYDVGEKFLDYNGDQAFSHADNLFNGPQCQGSNCAAANIQAIHVRKALRLVMASSAAEMILTNANNSITYHNSLTGQNTDIAPILDGATQEFVFNFADTGTPNQTMPMGTTVTVSSSKGELEGETSFTVGNNNREGFTQMNFFLFNTLGGDSVTAILTINITTPKGVITTLTRTISLP